ncbi:MAG: hypothetical protein U0269_30610 [Polyangiales bacterium]
MFAQARAHRRHVVAAMALPKVDDGALGWLAGLGLLPSHPCQLEAIAEIAVGGVLSPIELGAYARNAHIAYRRTGMLGPVIEPRLLCTALGCLILPTETGMPSALFRDDLGRWLITLPTQRTPRQRSFDALHEVCETLVGHRSHPDVQTLVPLVAIEHGTVNAALMATGSVQRAIARLQREHAHLPGWVVALATVWHGAEPP